MAVFSKPRSIWIGLLIVGIVVATVAVSDDVASEQLDFEHAGYNLAGQLVLPDTKGPYPAVIIVHGDGPSPWDAHGFYHPFIEAFTKAGIAVYAWDKPGVGKSGGNWLTQSMQDRADEVVAAGAALGSDPRIQSDSIGILGFSQAGWVAPKAAVQGDFAYLVSVSGAINWLEQSKYQTRNRLKLEGASVTEIRSVMAFERLMMRVLPDDVSYKTYTDIMENAPGCCHDLMSEDRWAFVKKNVESDAREDLRKIKIPVLGVFGERDLNVDASESARIYSETLRHKNPDNSVFLLKDADHLLLKTDTDRMITGGSTMLKQWLTVMISGADAFAQDAPDLIVRWVTGLEVVTLSSR